MIETIGTNAGKVWTALEKKGRQNIKDVRKATKLTEKDTYAALGWLAREGKITLEKNDKDVFISLI